MLYDTIQEAALIERKFGFPRGLMVWKVASAIRAAPKYVLSETVARMINTVAEKGPASLYAGLPICVMPHDRIWVEMRYDHMLKVLTEIGIRFHEIEGTSNPVNIGYLLEQAGDDHIIVTVAWDHKLENLSPEGRKRLEREGMDRHVMISTLSVGFDVSADVEVTEEDIRKEVEAGHEKDPGSWVGRFRQMKDFQASASFMKRIRADVSPYTEDYVDMILRGKINYPGGWKQLEAESLHDIGGEWRRALAILMVFNSKTAVEYVEQDRSKLSKARVRKGKLPTDNYKLVNMYLTKVQRNRLMTSGVKMADLAKHMVGAHFKVRKTGVFLWSAHVRGYVGEVKVPEKFVKE